MKIIQKSLPVVGWALSFGIFTSFGQCNANDLDVDALTAVERYGEMINSVSNFVIDIDCYVGIDEESPAFELGMKRKVNPVIAFEQKRYELTKRGVYTYAAAGHQERYAHEIPNIDIEIPGDMTWEKLFVSFDGSLVHTFDYRSNSGLHYSEELTTFDHLARSCLYGRSLGKRTIYSPPQDLLDVFRNAAKLKVIDENTNTIEIESQGLYFFKGGQCNLQTTALLSKQHGFLPIRIVLYQMDWEIRLAEVFNFDFFEVTPGFWLPAKVLTKSYGGKNIAKPIGEILFGTGLSIADPSTVRFNVDLPADYFIPENIPGAKFLNTDTNELIEIPGGKQKMLAVDTAENKPARGFAYSLPLGISVLVAVAVATYMFLRARNT